MALTPARIHGPLRLIPDARLDKTNHGASKWRFLFGYLRFLYRKSLLPILLKEFRSLCHRIALEMRTRQELSLGLPIVPQSLLATSVVGPEAYRHAYRRDMKKLEADQPFLSTSDLILATQMWRAGSNWCADNCHRLRSQERSSPLCSPDLRSGNLTPPSATQQHSKHDL
jgi:hypothetical protein